MYISRHRYYHWLAALVLHTMYYIYHSLARRSRAKLKMGTQTFTDSLTQVPAHCDGRCAVQVRTAVEVPAPKRQCAIVPWQQIEVESVTGSTLFHLVNMPLCLGWRGVGCCHTLI